MYWNMIVFKFNSTVKQNETTLSMWF